MFVSPKCGSPTSYRNAYAGYIWRAWGLLKKYTIIEKLRLQQIYHTGVGFNSHYFVQDT